MLDFKTALNLMKKYGYTSKSVHPYIYKSNNTIGVCYTYIDKHYGVLERVATFKSKDKMDSFLKKYQWFKTYGSAYNITMQLDDYETEFPNVTYLRDGNIMANDEMFNLEKYDSIREQEIGLKEIDNYIEEASNLIDIYNCIKDEQIALARSLDGLLEQQRSKYLELQQLVDNYNGVKIIRKKLTVEKRDELLGMDIEREKEIKKKLSGYKANFPSKDEILIFIHEICDLCMNLELNNQYYDNKIEDKKLNNIVDLANKKIEFMNKLLDKKKMIFKKNLKREFKKIDKKVGNVDIEKTTGLFLEEKEKIENKYSLINQIDELKISQYLKDFKSINNEIKIEDYQKEILTSENDNCLDYDEIIVDLKNKFNKLKDLEKNSLMLYFSKFGEFLKIIMVKDYNLLSTKNLIDKIKQNEKYNEYKILFYDELKEALETDSNKYIKNTVFKNYDFSTEESFIESCINTINILVNIKALKLNSEISLFFVTEDCDNFLYPAIIDTKFNMMTINKDYKEESQNVILATIRKNCPVLYSDKYIDFGASNGIGLITIMDKSNNSISFAINKVTPTKKDKKIILTKYDSKPVGYDDVLIVEKLNVNFKTPIYLVNFKKK